MPCYSPLQAFRTANGDIVFSQLKRHGDITQTLDLPCGQCIGCKLERSRQWAMRCMHEASLHKNNSFITLTYSDENLPRGGTLEYTHFQQFMRRLRKHTAPFKVRFYMCGEYGETNPETGEKDGGKYRPHYHANLFGHDWDDKTFHTRNKQGHPIYISATLDKLWNLGQTTTAAVTFETAAYTARYCVAKITGKHAHLVYGEREPEFNRMSLKPGIGAKWLEKYRDDVYNQDYVIVNGKETKPPKYYDKLLKRNEPETLDQLKAEREFNAYPHRADNTAGRLQVKEQVKRAQIQTLKRS